MLGTSKNIWGFDPRSVPGCSLWLDGADTGSMTLSGSTITQWNDKSGRGISIPSTGTPTITTVNGRSSVSFNGSSYFTTNFTALSGVSYVSWIAVANVTNAASANYGTIVGTSYASNNYAQNQLYVNQGNLMIFFRRVSGAANYNTTVALSSGSNILQSITNYTNGNYQLYQNGVASTLQTNGPTSAIASETVNLTIGYDLYPGETILTGTISEILLYTQPLTTDQRQQIEGYLAHKWGLTTPIPSTHPFKSIRPHLRTFQPADIPGCQLWLDAADSSSLVLSGSNVTQWNDKSGNGYHMNTIAGSTIWSGSAAYPTIGTSINGLQTVNFVAQSGLKQSTTLDGVKNLFWVGRIADATGSGTGPYYFLLGHDTHYDWHTPIGQKFIQSGAAQDGIANAFPASLFTNDPNAVTNTAFSSINLPSPPNVSLLSVAGITGNSRYQGICYDRTTHIGWCGDLAEVLIFNTALTTSQRQQVEGYLAQKWGLTPYLPVISPLSIPGCQLWLDGADPAGTGVQPSNGATVSTWVDKATAKNATATGTPTYLTGGGVNFNGSSYFLNQAFTMNLSQRSIFIVMQETSRTIYSGILTFIPTATSGSDFFSVETTNGFNFHGAAYDSVLGNSSLIAKGIYNDNMNVTTGSGYFNGTNATNVTAGAVEATCSGYGVGGRWLSGSMSGSYRLNGIIYEIIVFNTPLTTSQRQSIEGYLARKWGISISATLPSPHPFKSILPATAAHFYPTDITGCSLWLDAADPAGTGVLPSAGTLSTWVDKSGNGRNATTLSGTPTFALTPSRVTFNGSSWYSTTLSSVPTTETIFLVSSTTNDIAGGQGQIGCTTSNFGGRGLFQANSEMRYTSFGVANRAGNGNGFVNGSIFITDVVFEGTNSQVFINGVGGTVNTTTSFSGSGTTLIGSLGGATQPFFGSIYEVIIFNTGLTTTQRQKVEGYLAHKWGLVNSLPSKHPYKPSPPIFPPNLFFPTPSMYSVLFNSGSLSVPANAALTLGTNNHTFEFWLYQTSRNFYDCPFMYGNTAGNATNNYYMNLGQYTGVLIGNGSPGGWSLNMANGVSLPALNTWSHYAVVRNGNTFTLYLNGTNVGSATASISIPAQGGVMAIGGLNSSGNTISGYMTNFRFVNGTAVYTSNFTPPTTPLTAIPNTQVLIQGLVDRGPNAFTVTSTGGVTLSTSVSPF